MTFLLNALSPVDGRYSDKADKLRPIFSEYGLIKKRVSIEIKWLIALSENQEIKEIPAFSDGTLKKLNGLITSFDEQDAQAVKDIERITNHDVKAVEYWIKNALISEKEILAVSEFIHFACTSEDINNLSYALMLKEGIANVVVPEIKNIHQKLTKNAIEFSAIPLLARTHGQTASPTTLGKEFANVAQRISRQLVKLSEQKYLGKMNGAVGNFNAHTAAYPDVDWNTFSKTFVTSLGLEYNEFTYTNRTA